MKLFKFLYEDLKSDLAFIKDVLKGKYKWAYFAQIGREIGKNIASVDFWKRNWQFFLLIALAFLMGALMSAWYYEGVCNQHIIDNFYNTMQNIVMYGGNITLLY